MIVVFTSIGLNIRLCNTRRTIVVPAMKDTRGDIAAGPVSECGTTERANINIDNTSGEHQVFTRTRSGLHG